MKEGAKQVAGADVVKEVVKKVGTAAVVAVGNTDLDADNTDRRRDILKEGAKQFAGAVAAATVDRTPPNTYSSIEMLQIERRLSDTETSFEDVVNSLLGVLD